MIILIVLLFTQPVNESTAYDELADVADDADTKAFFEELARWEAAHHSALRAEQDHLRKSYWAANDFAPF